MTSGNSAWNESAQAQHALQSAFSYALQPEKRPAEKENSASGALPRCIIGAPQKNACSDPIHAAAAITTHAVPNIPVAAPVCC
jgi:hypothetical protein